MRLPQFLRLYEIRAQRIMWFLGAGSSVAAGLPTAWDLIWQFKKKIYCSEQRVPPGYVSDLGNAAVRARIQHYFDNKGGFPSSGTEDEYSAFFEATYNSDRDRRAFLEPFLATKAPSFGHYVLAHLMKAGKATAVWTTNFDKLVEEAAAKVFGSVASLLTADLGEPDKAERAFTEGRWPLLVKLHGDFHSERLKNTREELQSQDKRMRDCLFNSSKQYGLAVVGYSGRDSSILEVFEAAVDSGGFQNGFFWFKREGDEPFPRVLRLITRLQEKGIEAALIDITNFDELFGDIARFMQGLDQAALASIAPKSARLASSIVPNPSKRPPFIRSNAIPIVSMSSTCRLIECDIGGYEAVQAAIAQANVDIIAQRSKVGVIAFGRDEDLKKAFNPYNIQRLDFHAISGDRLARSSGELSLFYDSLSKALSRIPGIRVKRNRSSCSAIAEAGQVAPETFSGNGVNPIDVVEGMVKSTTIRWCEGVSIQFDHRASRNWLLLRPKIFLDETEGKSEVEILAAKDFVRERLAVRHNREYAAILDGWIKVLFGAERRAVLRAFAISDGSDAVFEIETITGYSGRL